MFWKGFFKSAGTKITGDADMAPGEGPQRSNNDYQDSYPKGEDPIAKENAKKGES